MEAARSWIRDNASVRDEILRRFESDPRLEQDALPDAIASDPAVLVDLTKELVVAAVRRDAPEGVAEELLTAVRRMATGARELSPYVRTVLKSFRGLRDVSELEPVIRNALQDADDADRAKLQGMLEAMQRSELILESESEIVMPEGADFSPGSCVDCCFIGCVVCTEACLICCGVGCVVCG